MSHFGSLAFAAATAIAAWQSPRVHRAPNPHAELVVVLEHPRHLGGFLGNSGSVAPLPGGRFCVSDTSSGRVLLIGSDGTRLASSPAMFEAPAALALSPSCDSVYLADATGHALHRLSLPDLSPICSTRPVEGARGLCYPAGLAVSPRDGRVFVSDKGNHRVVCYDAALSVELFSHGRCGGGEGELNSPSGLALLGGGGAEEARLVVADTDNHRLVLLGSEGGFVRSIGGRSDAPPPGLSAQGLYYGHISPPPTGSRAGARRGRLGARTARKVRTSTAARPPQGCRAAVLASQGAHRLLWLLVLRRRPLHSGRCCAGWRAVRPPAAAAPAPSLAGAVAPRAPNSAGTRHASSLSRGEQAVQRAKRSARDLVLSRLDPAIPRVYL